jgi:hypothetical protein
MLSSPAVIAAFDLSRFTSFVDLLARPVIWRSRRGLYPKHVGDAVRSAVVVEWRKFAGDRVSLIAGDFVDALPAATHMQSGAFCTIETEENRGALGKILRRCRSAGIADRRGSC